MSAPLVAELQRRIGVPADGVYGPATHRRLLEMLRAPPAAASEGWVQRLQGRLGVPADGRLGPRTLAAIFQHMGALTPMAEELGRAAAVHLPRQGITDTPERLTEWFGEMAHESGGFQRLTENLNYSSAERIRTVWPSRFPTVAAAQPFVRQPEKLANFVYGGRMGNGPAASGDGWRYRGRGLIHLTGRENYALAGLAATPEKAAEPETAVRVAADYWAARGLNALADTRQSETISARINGKHPANGLADRNARKARMRALVA